MIANMCRHFQCGALILAVAAVLLACCKGNGEATNPTASAVEEAAPAAGTLRIDKDATAPSGLDAGAEDSTPAVPGPQTSPAKASKADIARIKRCCKTFETLGQAKPNQEGVGLIGLSSVCDDIASSLEHGEPPPLNYSDWEMIRPVLDDKSVPASCRAIMLKFEKQ